MTDLPAGGCTAPVFAFFSRRWHGAVSLHRLFWWDMVAIATLLNAIVGIVSLIMLTRGLAGGAWLALHLLLLPYNLFLVVAIWRRTDAGHALRLAGLGWLALTVAL